MVQPAEGKAPGRISSSLLVPKRAYKGAREGLITWACSKENGLRLKKVRLDFKKKFFILRVKREWNTLPRNVVDNLKEFNAKFDGAFPHSSGRYPYSWQRVLELGDL